MFTLKELEQQHSSTYSKRVKMLDILGTNKCRNSSFVVFSTITRIHARQYNGLTLSNSSVIHFLALTL